MARYCVIILVVIQIRQNERDLIFFEAIFGFMFACGCNNGTIRKGLYLRLRLVRGSDNSSVAVLRLFRHSFYPILSLSSLRIFEKPDVLFFLSPMGCTSPSLPIWKQKKKNIIIFRKRGLLGCHISCDTNWAKTQIGTNLHTFFET